MDRLLGAAATAVPHGVLLGVRQSMAIARRANNKARQRTSINKTNNMVSTHDALAALRRGRRLSTSLSQPPFDEYSTYR